MIDVSLPLAHQGAYKGALLAEKAGWAIAHYDRVPSRHGNEVAAALEGFKIVSLTHV